MKHDTFAEYHHWYVQTVVGIDNPDDWKRGDPDRYRIWGHAEFPPNGIDAFSWAVLDPLKAESDTFYDPALAERLHEEVAGQLELMIDGCRHPDW